MPKPYDSIVSQYTYHDGGAAIPVSKLVNMTALSSTFGITGGGVETEKSSALKRLEHLGVPAGLVFLPPQKHENIEYASQFGLGDDDVIEDAVYDKLVDLVSKHTGKRPKRRTRTRRQGTAKNETRLSK